MATHPRMAAAAATNGHGNSGSGKLDRLLAYHEQAAAAIRMTIGLMNGHEKTTKANGHSTVLAQAIALDGARVAKTKTKKGRPTGRAGILAQRARTIAVLDSFDTAKPREPTHLPHGARGLTPLINHGYLKKKRGGYIRTAKPYAANPFAAEG